MKKIIATLCLVFAVLVIANAQTTPPSMSELINEAKTVAQQENKNILIHFHASWCKYCKKFESKLHKKKVEDFFNNNFVIRGVTVREIDKYKHLENPGGNEWLISNDFKKTGFPFYVFMDKNGKIIETSLRESGRTIGYPSNEVSLDAFIGKLKKVTTVSPEDEESIRATFSK